MTVTKKKPYIDFSKRIGDLTEVFIGREWLIKEIDKFLIQNKDHYLIITGVPGIGKSALAARLTQLGKVHAHHFCMAHEGGTLEPIAFVRSMSQQLAYTLEGFAQKVIEQEQIEINPNIKLRAATSVLKNVVCSGPHARLAGTQKSWSLRCLNTLDLHDRSSAFDFPRDSLILVLDCVSRHVPSGPKEFSA